MADTQLVLIQTNPPTAPPPGWWAGVFIEGRQAPWLAQAEPLLAPRRQGVLDGPLLLGQPPSPPPPFDPILFPRSVDTELRSVRRQTVLDPLAMPLAPPAFAPALVIRVWAEAPRQRRTTAPWEIVNAPTGSLLATPLLPMFRMEGQPPFRRAALMAPPLLRRLDPPPPPPPPFDPALVAPATAFGVSLPSPGRRDWLRLMTWELWNPALGSMMPSPPLSAKQLLLVPAVGVWMQVASVEEMLKVQP